MCSLCRRLNHDSVETDMPQHVRHYFTRMAGTIPRVGCFVALCILGWTCSGGEILKLFLPSSMIELFCLDAGAPRRLL